MGLILNLETSTQACSAAISDNGKTLAFKEIDTGEYDHASKLTVFVEQLLSENNLTVKQFDAIAVSKGPGSFTGLRIGVSAAKGLAYGAGIKLIAIDTTEIMAHTVINELNKNTNFILNNSDILCPMLDARRMEVYYSLYDLQLNRLNKIEAKIIDKESFAEQLTNHRVYFFGSGAEKCKTVITGDNVCFIENIVPLARNMAELSEKALNNNHFEDVAYFEPFYLKDFVATVSKKAF